MKVTGSEVLLKWYITRSEAGVLAMETRSAFNGGVTVYILDKISQKYISVLLGINQSINQSMKHLFLLRVYIGPMVLLIVYIGNMKPFCIVTPSPVFQSESTQYSFIVSPKITSKHGKYQEEMAKVIHTWRDTCCCWKLEKVITWLKQVWGKQV